MEFHERLKMLRTEKDIRQKELGHVLEYGYTTISNYESGRNEPSIDDLKKIAKFFDVSLDYLLCASDLKRSYQEEQKPEMLQKFEKIYYSSNPLSKQLLSNFIDLLYQLQVNSTL